jgi:hypothetical protein
VAGSVAPLVLVVGGERHLRQRLLPLLLQELLEPVAAVLKPFLDVEEFGRHLNWRHDTQHIDTQHNNTQHNAT